MSLFSQKNKEVFTAPLNLDNPIVAQVLGICSALAVTSQLEPSSRRFLMSSFRSSATLFPLASASSSSS